MQCKEATISIRKPGSHLLLTYMTQKNISDGENDDYYQNDNNYNATRMTMTATTTTIIINNNNRAGLPPVLG